jgi:pimeloyl-ACP methyl ester carboxylesterase
MKKKSKNSRGKKRMIAFAIAALLIVIFLLVQHILCSIAVKDGYTRLEAYHANVAELSYGSMTYVDQGVGDVILSIHGICGGYDQGFDTVAGLVSDYRIIAPSRFGYLGSDVPAEPTPKEQAKAFVELLDSLGIDKACLLATSAGSTIAIRFALDYPERITGLVLYSPAAPLTEKPDTWADYQGPPSFLCNDFGMWMLHPFFGPIMGMEPDTIYSMLPFSERRGGTIMDASITNPDMAKHYDEYEIEALQIPSMIFAAKDDKMSSFELTEKAVQRFPDCTFVGFETGGHLMTGHGDEMNAALEEFLGRLSYDDK